MKIRCQMRVQQPGRSYDGQVFGMRDLQLQKKLFSTPKLTFEIALEEARASEAAEQTAAAIQKQEPQRTATVHKESCETEDSMEEEDGVHRVRAKGRSRAPEKWDRTALCAGCRENHPRGSCRFLDALCQRCETRKPAGPTNRPCTISGLGTDKDGQKGRQDSGNNKIQTAARKAEPQVLTKLP